MIKSVPYNVVKIHTYIHEVSLYYDYECMLHACAKFFTVVTVVVVTSKRARDYTTIWCMVSQASAHCRVSAHIPRFKGSM